MDLNVIPSARNSRIFLAPASVRPCLPGFVRMSTFKTLNGPQVLDIMYSWDRREDEDETSWVAFKCYRDQSAPRNLRRTAAALPDHTVLQVIDLANRYAWRERCREYDLFVDKALQEERLDFLKQDARERTACHLALLKDARETVSAELRKLLEWTERTPGINVLQPRDVFKLLDSVVKLERLVSGETTENTHTSMDLSGLSVDDLRTLAPVLEKVGVHLPSSSSAAKKN